MTVIIAVGCAGGRMVNKIISASQLEAEYLAVNTDRCVLEPCLAGRKILIGEQRCQGRSRAQLHVIMEESAAFGRPARAGHRSSSWRAWEAARVRVLRLWSSGSHSARIAKRRRW